MTTTQPQAPTRLHFIDVLRAFAILMMLQGHFIDATLAPEFRDYSNFWYSSWDFMRGLTAPVFFTVTGLVFTYLLLGDMRPPAENTRWKKGIKRGFILIALGYLLKMNVTMFIGAYLPGWVFTTDVLQCIGLAILLIAGLFWLFKGNKLWISLSLLLIALLIIGLDPTRLAMDVSGLPLLLQHYLTTDTGSTFTPFPWVAFSCFGALLGSCLRWKPRLAFGHLLPVILVAIGLSTHFFSSSWLMSLFDLTGWQNFKDLAYSNMLLMRTGQTMALVGSFMWVIGCLKKVPSLLTTIGSETLTIYCGHYVILYGSVFGLGLAHLLSDSLTPVWAVAGATLLVAFFVASMRFLSAIRAYGSIFYTNIRVSVLGSFPLRVLKRSTAYRPW